MSWLFSFIIGNTVYSIPKRLPGRLAPLVLRTSPQPHSSLPSGQPCKVSMAFLLFHYLLFKAWRICSEEKWQTVPALWEIVFLPHWRLLCPCTIALVPLCFEGNRITPGYNADCILLFGWVFFQNYPSSKEITQNHCRGDLMYLGLLSNLTCYLKSKIPENTGVTGDWCPHKSFVSGSPFLVQAL